MTISKKAQASKQIERRKLISDILKFNPDITANDLARYDIDDLRKIKMANMPQPVQGNTAGRPMMKYGNKIKSKYSKGGGVRKPNFKFK